MNYKKLADEYLSSEKITALQYKMALIFRNFLKYKMWKYELHQNLDNSCMAFGERVCLNLAFLVAIQPFEMVEFSITAGDPLGFLDAELRQGVSESLFYRELVSATIANNHSFSNYCQ